ncbi:MAG: exo-alpha-sialidase [Clostridiales bacterium]|nr:exo-alpha-sialidase [Clostridiales bacterium]
MSEQKIAMPETALKKQYSTIIDQMPKRAYEVDGKKLMSPPLLYGRILRISHSQRGDNGVLISTFEKKRFLDPMDWGKRVPGHPVMRSDDNGKTWRTVNEVMDPDHPHFMQYLMPTIFELPCAMGDFPAGTLLMGTVTTHPQEGSYLNLYYSLDTGSTWVFMGALDHGGPAYSGVWEPFFHLAADGTLVCHYCDERNYTFHSQKLVYRTTKDLRHWSLLQDSVACKEPSYRPGMPVVTRLSDGRYFMVYEMVGMEGNPVYCKYSPDGLDWGDPQDFGRRIYSVQGGSLGSSPYCLWVNRGGEKGTLIVSGGFMSAGAAAGGPGHGTDYFVSFDGGETFTQWPHPIPYKDTDHASHTGYSNSYFFWDEGNTLYSINNIGSEDGNDCLMIVAVSQWIDE